MHDYHLQLSPSPSLLTHTLDAENNPQTIAFFDGMATSLQLVSQFEIELSTANPFSFLIYPFQANTLPFHYADNELKFLVPYMLPTDFSLPIIQYAEALAHATNHDTLMFLGQLIQRISSEFAYEFREQGEPKSPSQVWAHQNGSCRDFANFCMDVCRHHGIAARFVSGYFYSGKAEERHLHGWVEVYLPGGGWRGIDPTQGVWADEHYIPLATAANPTKVAPICGSYRGNATQTMFAEVTMQLLH